jgi:hypothetical protein
MNLNNNEFVYKYSKFNIRFPLLNTRYMQKYDRNAGRDQTENKYKAHIY